MADNKEKASKVLQKMFGISPMEYDTMRLNARRWETTDAGVEDAILKQIYARDDVQSVLKGKSGTTLRQDSVASMKPVFGRTKVFNAKNVLEAIKDTVPGKDSKQSPEEVLVKLYDENPNYVRNRVRMDPDFGDWGADNLEKLVESSRGVKWQPPKVGKAEKVVRTILTPRVLEAMEDGREPSKKDWGLDLAENVLMALPLGLGVGAVTKGITRGRRAAQAAGTVAGAGAVPFATEGLDAYFYSPTENLDRSVFQPSDAILGTVTNVTAPYMLSRIGGRAGRWLSSGNPVAKAGDSEVAKAAELRAVEKAADNDAAEVLKKWIDNGTIVPPDERTSERVSDMIMKDMFLKYRNDPKYIMAAQGAGQYDRGVINSATVAADAAMKEFEKEQVELLGKADIIAGFMKAGDSYQEAIRKATDLGDMANRMQREAFRQLEEAELRNEVAKLSKPSMLGAMAGSWGVNKYGNQRNADAGVAVIDALLQSADLSAGDFLDTLRAERGRDAQDKYRASTAASVLENFVAGPDSTADRYWLGKLATNPEIMRGEGEGATTEFKNWWNTRGLKLFEGNRQFRGSKK